MTELRAEHAPARNPSTVTAKNLDMTIDDQARRVREEAFAQEAEKFKPITFAMLRRLFVLLKPYKWTFVIGLFAGAVATALELVSPTIIQCIIDQAIPSGEISQIGFWAAIWAVTVLLVLLCESIQIGATQRSGERVINDLRESYFRQLQRLTMSYYDKTKLGRIITIGTSDLEALRGTVTGGINTVILNVLLMLGAAVMMCLKDWRIFLAVFWLAPILAIINRIYIDKVGRAHQITRAHFSALSANLAENITGVRVVEAFNRQDENLERFNLLQQINTQNNYRTQRINGIYQPILQMISFAGQCIVLSYGGYLSMRGQIQPGEVIALFFYWNFYMRPTITLGNFYNTLMMSMASGERLFAMLDLEPQIVDKPGAKPLPPLRGEIRMEKVVFGYDPQKPVLHGIELEIPAGQTIALVGHTGSGKSSILSLLARFYEFQSGRIAIDGHDIRECTQKSLHKQMGIVLQMNYLFTGTVMDNIRYAKPSAPDEDVYAAAKSLDIHDLLESLPNGYQTLVGERGMGVSLGIRQLICFARVFLANPRIFLLDEATSSIDTVTETRVQQALEKLVKDRTTVIVAHRLSTIVNADCIVVLDHGHIVERGTHRELLKTDGVYHGMYRRFAAGMSVE